MQDFLEKAISKCEQNLNGEIFKAIVYTFVTIAQELRLIRKSIEKISSNSVKKSSVIFDESTTKECQF